MLCKEENERKTDEFMIRSLEEEHLLAQCQPKSTMLLTWDEHRQMAEARQLSEAQVIMIALPQMSQNLTSNMTQLDFRFEQVKDQMRNLTTRIDDIDDIELFSLSNEISSIITDRIATHENQKVHDLIIIIENIIKDNHDHSSVSQHEQIPSASIEFDDILYRSNEVERSLNRTHQKHLSKAHLDFQTEDSSLSIQSYKSTKSKESHSFNASALSFDGDRIIISEHKHPHLA